MSGEGVGALRPDCGRCAGLCCVAPAFEASADFAFDKPARQACHNLRDDFGCSVHDDLRERGLRGCAVFDCQGAGQRVTQVTFGGRTWRDSPEIASDMFNAFAIMRQLHELLWFLNQAIGHPAARSMRPELTAALTETERLANLRAGSLMMTVVHAHRENVKELLRRTGDRVRAAAPRPSDLGGAGTDLVGRDLRGADLRGADLRNASLIGADLRGAALGHANLIGADLRAADLRGADLGAAVFVTQFQVNSATGDAGTALPPMLARPAHWR